MIGTKMSTAALTPAPIAPDDPSTLAMAVNLALHYQTALNSPLVPHFLPRNLVLLNALSAFTRMTIYSQSL
jgi:hypothetical protein